MPLPTPELVKEVFEPKLALFNDDKDLMEKCEVKKKTYCAVVCVLVL